MRNITPLFLALLLILTACGGEDNTNDDTGLEGVEQKSTATQPVEASPTAEIEATDSTAAQPEGYLAYIQDDILVVLDLASQTTQEVAHNVLPNYIYSAPDQTEVYYAVLDTAQKKVFFYGYTFADDTIQQFAEAPPPRLADMSLWLLDGWSPNDEWAVLRTYQMGIRPLLVNTRNQIEPITLSNALLNTPPLWTTDNQLISVTHESGLPPIDIPAHEYFAPVEAIQLIHLPDAEETNITSGFALNDINSDTELRQAIEEAGYDLFDFPTDPLPEIWMPAGRYHEENRSEYCWTYQIAQSGENRYVAEDVYTMGNLENLDDGSLVFMQIEFADCSFLNGPVGKLVRLTQDNEVIVLTDTLMSMRDRNTARSHLMQARYDIAPQQDYAVFIATDESGTSTMLQIVDINSGEPMPVLLDGQPVENILGVVWGYRP